MRRIILPLIGMVAGAIATYSLISMSAETPIEFVSAKEADGVSVKGGRIELALDIKQNRSCPAVVDRQLWKWSEDTEGRRVKLIVPLASISTPLRGSAEERIIISLAVPQGIDSGEWFYASRSNYNCPIIAGLMGNRIMGNLQVISPNVPIMIMDPIPGSPGVMDPSKTTPPK